KVETLKPVERVPAVDRLVQTLFVVLAVGEVFVKHALGVVTQFGHVELVVRQIHDVQGLFGNRYTLEIGDDSLCAVRGGQVGLALKVILGDMDFVLSQGGDQPRNALASIFGVPAVRVACNQLV